MKSLYWIYGYRLDGSYPSKEEVRESFLTGDDDRDFTLYVCNIRDLTEMNVKYIERLDNKNSVINSLHYLLGTESYTHLIHNKINECKMGCWQAGMPYPTNEMLIIK